MAREHVNLEDLPPHLRAQAEAQLGRSAMPGPVRAKKDRTKPTGPRMPMRCRACGQRFDSPTEGQLSKHTAATRHLRYELILGTVTPLS